MEEGRREGGKKRERMNEEKRTMKEKKNTFINSQHGVPCL